MNYLKNFSTLAVFAACFFISCEKAVPLDNEVIARVNDSYLLKEDVVSLNEDLLPGYVSRWVDQEILYQAAVKNNIHKDRVVQKQVENYKKDLLGKLFIETYYDELPDIREDELRTYYNQQIDEFTRIEEEAKVYHFIFLSRSDANSAVKILKNNSSGDQRRELFNNSFVENIIVKRGFLAKDLNDALFNSRAKNRTIGPLKIGDIYHVLEVQERFPKDSRIGFDEAYDEIYQRLLHRAMMKIEMVILDSLKEETYIKVNLEQP